MSIASAITAAQGRVADCYTAISGKGGTLPATQNLANMPTAINSIPSGGGSTKYGASADTLLGDPNSSGVLQGGTEQSDLVFDGVEDVANYMLYYKFFSSKVKSVSFPDLTKAGYGYCLSYTFASCSSLTTISLPELTIVSGVAACNCMFNNCSSLTSVSLPELTTISALSGCLSMFSGCSSLVTVSFPKLVTITGGSCMQSIFSYCSKITDVYFNSLTTTSFGSNVNQFNNMFSSAGITSGSITMHFPSNLSSTISGLTSYPNFGAATGRLTLAFDLPATS